MRLRKGFGSVKKLSGENRRNRYAVYPPKVKGVAPKAICYVKDRGTGICCLNAWHNGVYYPGMELDLKEKRLDEVVSSSSAAFYTVYQLYWDHRFGESAAKELKRSSQAAMRSAWKQMESVWYKTLDEVTIIELQEIVNKTARSYSKTTVTRLLCLIKGLYKFAVPRELCRKESGLYVETPRIKEEEHHEAFTDEEIEKLWTAASNSSAEATTPVAPGQAIDGDATEIGSEISAGKTGAEIITGEAGVGISTAKPGVEISAGTDGGRTGRVDISATARMILTMIYSGYRIGAWSVHDDYYGMKVDLEEMTFTGGVKTEAGKNRVVPIHSSIRDLVAGMKVSTVDGEAFSFLCGKSESQFRRDMKATL